MAKRIHLGKHFEAWEGWTIDSNGLASPNTNFFTPQDIEVFHWEKQILAELQSRLKRPEQFDMFEENMY
jgi:hypothetical protein